MCFLNLGRLGLTEVIKRTLEERDGPMVGGRWSVEGGRETRVGPTAQSRQSELGDPFCRASNRFCLSVVT